MKKQRKYTLTVTEDQLLLIAQCVEDCHRFAAGQMEMQNTTCMTRDMHEFQKKLRELQHYMTPELREGSSYKWSGIGCPDEYQRKFIARTYCIYREILHRLHTINRKPSDDWDVYNNPTLTCEEGGPLPVIETVKN